MTADGGVLDGLRTTIHQLTNRPVFDETVVRLRALADSLDDVSNDLRLLTEQLEDDPERLAAIRERRQLLRNLRRKYGETLHEVMAERDQLVERLGALKGRDAELVRLDAAMSEAHAAVAVAAARVASDRRTAAPKLAADVQKVLRTLALKSAMVEVAVAGDGPADEVTFLFSANKGEPLQPLAKVASGGELARTMLALRLVLTEAPDTLIFDEVDAGIGGQAALAIGQALRQLGERHQVLVVTHLAQVAACADQHIVVEKREHQKRTVASVRPLAGDERAREVARMLSGHGESGAAIDHARELLAASAPRGTRSR